MSAPRQLDRKERAAPRRALLVVRALIAVCTLVGLLVGAAAARAGSPRQAVFALQPLGASEHPGYFRLTARPGSTLRRDLRIVNTGPVTGTVRLYPVDATTGQTTGATYRDGTAPRRDVGAWVRIGSPQLRLMPGESRTVPVVIAVPSRAAAGDHLGGITAENASVRRGVTRRHGSSSFRIDVRSLNIVAVQVTVPGPIREAMSVTSISLGATGAQQALLVGLSNTGNRLVKGTGVARIDPPGGRPARRIPFVLDTFLPGTNVRDPLPIPGTGLPAGRYPVEIRLQYGHGHRTQLRRTLQVSDAQLRQVYGSVASEPPTASRGGGVTPIVLVGAAAALLGLGFLGAMVVMRSGQARSDSR